jgi:hypothetical protein
MTIAHRSRHTADTVRTCRSACRFRPGHRMRPMFAFLPDVVLSLLPTFVCGRGLLWLTRAWSESVGRLFAVHLASFGLCLLAVGSLTVEVIAGRWTAALALLLPGQLIWLLVDAFRLVRRRRRGE